ncbi:MAG: hypothetical protein FJY92_08295, partial [Candidatus Hydrogenedentes bacterium]|nr:hypothetical protein [Candidatus Hydrogenedentota bacterium]
AFDHAGRMFVAESSGKNVKGKDMPKFPECMILMIEDTDGDGVFDKRTVFADKLSLPMGVLWYRGAVYCASPPDFLRFEDTDGDGVADKREVLLTGWNVLNTASLHGPFLGPDGYMYLTHGRHGYDITSKEGVHYQGLASRIWRCKPDGTQLERFCGGGFDNPIELVWNDAGDLFGTMTYFTDPMNGQRDALMHWVEGGVYPKMHESTAEFVRTGELMPVLTKFARIAPSGLEIYRGANFGDEYKGNLFSAQFNPHRVQRHVLTPNGASYTCADSDFLTSSDPDFHPTDVIEDADGTILVSDTGGWYVDACPISRVAKPEVRGSIYRIRKLGGHTVHDPRGLQRIAELSNAPGARLHGRDETPSVRDFAMERLIERGDDDGAIVGEIEKRLGDGSPLNDEDYARLARALAQIDTPSARRVLRECGLRKNPCLVQNAAYLLGTIGDIESVDLLIDLLQRPHGGIRRAAAASLGHLKAERSVAALLQASSSANDRFVEHAIIYALIQIGAQEGLLNAVSDTNSAASKAAFIALDQLKSDKLTADHAIAFLNSDSEDLRKTGLWVASRHPEWSGSVLALLEQKVNAADFAPESAGPIRDVVLSYAADAKVQEFMARVAGDDTAPAARRLFMLDTIEKAGVNPLPDAIVQSVGKSLESADETVRYRAATLIASRKISAFDGPLLALADKTDETPALRISALGTVQARAPELDDARLGFL